MPTALVVKNGSKIFLRTSCGMPTPVSANEIATWSPAGWPARPSPAGTLRAEIVKVPPSGIASRALTAMLTSASSNSATSASTGHRSSGSSMASVMLPRSELLSIGRISCTRCAQVDRHRIERLAPREGQELAGQALAAPGGAHDRLDRAQLGSGR